MAMAARLCAHTRAALLDESMTEERMIRLLLKTARSDFCPQMVLRFARAYRLRALLHRLSRCRAVQGW
jgi:hypothetical protein